jgi:glycosyltransferase involved in cell wall biosynthesis
MAALAITYLLEGSGLFGGTKVALQQANLMARRGHDVTVVSREPAPDWFPVQARFLVNPSLNPSDLPAADVTVATYWTTLEAAVQVAGSEAVHYCQGFEVSYTHNYQDHPRIEAAYSMAVPAMAVAPHLVDLLQRHYGRPARLVGQGLAPLWRPARRRRPRRPPRILVVSPFEIDWKGVKTALLAVKRLRAEGVDCRLVRLSQWSLAEEETTCLESDEFHHHLAPPQVADLMKGCDLILAPSWEQEGFGLPVLEAMGCGVPAVVSDVPCFRYFAAEAARLVRYDDPEALAAAAREILDQPALWRRMRRAGLRVAACFSEERFAEVSEETLYWVANGEWRQEMSRRSPE